MAGRPPAMIDSGPCYEAFRANMAAIDSAADLPSLFGDVFASSRSANTLRAPLHENERIITDLRSQITSTEEALRKRDQNIQDLENIRTFQIDVLIQKDAVYKKLLEQKIPVEESLNGTVFIIQSLRDNRASLERSIQALAATNTDLNAKFTTANKQLEASQKIILLWQAKFGEIADRIRNIKQERDASDARAKLFEGKFIAEIKARDESKETTLQWQTKFNKLESDVWHVEQYRDDLIADVKKLTKELAF